MQLEFRVIGMLSLVAISCIVLSGCQDIKDARRVKQISLLKHLYFELYAEDAPVTPNEIDFRQSESVKAADRRTRESFLTDLRSGDFTFHSKDGSQEDQFVMIWDCSDYTLTCTQYGGVEIVEPKEGDGQDK